MVTYLIMILSLLKQMSDDLEDKIDVTILNAEVVVSEYATSIMKKYDTCGCNNCRLQAVSMAKWYNRISKRTYQLELDNIDYATSSDYNKYHTK